LLSVPGLDPKIAQSFQGVGEIEASSVDLLSQAWSHRLRSRLVHASVLVALALTAVLWASPAAAQNRVLIGMSTPLSGTYSAYGQGLQHRAQLAIQNLNASGGIGGSKLELLVLDDGGDPTRSAANTHALAQRGVVALAGYHGARSVEAALCPGSRSHGA
jgi:hypothetical protein